ncbi:TasA family protein [Brevibacillus sp. NRS-1366]|uniref:TasA family protein n=1 Tax=Brevibacillus sp. NRS-1366 TaxID=3233899 RepID=UPI003D219EB8
MGFGSILVSGATFLYLSDKEVVNNTFATGTQGLTLGSTVHLDIKDVKPGDDIIHYFTITNSGSLDMAKVLLHTNYTVLDSMGNNGTEDFGEHLFMEFLTPDGQIILQNQSLADLKKRTDSGESPDISGFNTNRMNLRVGEAKIIAMRFHFNDNDQDQNIFQGDQITLHWNLEAVQGIGNVHQ